MKKMVAILLLLLLVGCCPTSNNQSNLEVFQSDSSSIFATEDTQVDKEIETIPTTKPATDAQAPTGAGSQDNEESPQKEAESVVNPTVFAKEPTSTSTDPTHGGQKDDAPEESKPSPTDPKPTQPATESTEPPPHRTHRSCRAAAH